MAYNVMFNVRPAPTKPGRKKRAAGLTCRTPGCNEDSLPDRPVCADCHSQQKRALSAKKLKEDHIAVECRTPGCLNDSLPDRPVCKPCHMKQKQYLQKTRIRWEQLEAERENLVHDAEVFFGFGPEKYNPEDEDDDSYPHIDADGNLCSESELDTQILEKEDCEGTCEDTSDSECEEEKDDSGFCTPIAVDLQPLH